MLGALLISHSVQRIGFIRIPSIALDKIGRIGLFSSRGSNRNARGGVAAEGTSWGEKMTATRIENASARLGSLFFFCFSFFSAPPY